MTTIIIIVVVALVFFVTVCVVTFMVWKRETEIRTDSIRAIESNLEKLGDRLTEDAGSSGFVSENSDLDRDALREDAVKSRSYQNARRRLRSRDPFAWTRENEVPSDSDTDTVNTADMEETAGDSGGYGYSDAGKAEAVAASAEVHASGPGDTGTEEDEYRVNAADMTDYTDTADEPDRYEAGEDNADYISQIDDFEIEMPEIPVESGEEKVKSFEEDETDSALNEMITPELQKNSSYHVQEKRRYHSHDIGRSGKKYTSEELDMLIKE